MLQPVVTGRRMVVAQLSRSRIVVITSAALDIWQKTDWFLRDVSCIYWHTANLSLDCTNI